MDGKAFDAAIAGKSETENPYPVETDAHLSWNDGWQAVQDAGDGDE